MVSEYDTKAEGAEGMGLYEQHLKRQAQELRDLKLQRGAPSLRRIQARAKRLFGDGVPLPPATQHGAFNGHYVGLDRLIVLVRTLMSWDLSGQFCPAPDRDHPDPTHWQEQWRVIAELRSQPHRPALARTPLPVSAGLGPAEPDNPHSGASEPVAAPPSAVKPPSAVAPTPHPSDGSGRFAFQAGSAVGNAVTLQPTASGRFEEFLEALRAIGLEEAEIAPLRKIRPQLE
ncbi:hypothetical protein ACTMUQ_41520 [Streptomyces sp. SD11]|uniref:hypothetical protein n=1 Tax=Streptomyces sp. SD11 TaxID=3452209 RepID=UPI003F8B0E5E